MNMKKIAIFCAMVVLMGTMIAGCSPKGQEASLPVVSTTFYGQSFQGISLPIEAFQEQFNEKAPDGYQVSFSSNATNYYQETWEDGIQLSLTYDDAGASIVSVHLSLSLEKSPDMDNFRGVTEAIWSVLIPSSTQEQYAQAVKELGMDGASFDSWQEGETKETVLNGMQNKVQKTGDTVALELFPEYQEESQG